MAVKDNDRMVQFALTGNGVRGDSGRALFSLSHVYLSSRLNLNILDQRQGYSSNF